MAILGVWGIFYAKTPQNEAENVCFFISVHLYNYLDLQV